MYRENWQSKTTASDVKTAVNVKFTLMRVPCFIVNDSLVHLIAVKCNIFTLTLKRLSLSADVM